MVCVFFCPFLFPRRPGWLWGLYSLLFRGYQGSFQGINQSGREVKHSPASSAEVKNEWSYTFTPPVCSYGMDRENFTFYHR